MRCCETIFSHVNLLSFLWAKISGPRTPALKSALMPRETHYIQSPQSRAETLTCQIDAILCVPATNNHVSLINTWREHTLSYKPHLELYHYLTHYTLIRESQASTPKAQTLISKPQTSKHQPETLNPISPKP